MKKNKCYALFAFFFLLVFSPPSYGKHPMAIDDLFQIKSVSEPQLSPDGKTVVYVISVPDFENNKYNRDICRISSSGGELVQLTNDPQQDFSPRWSPDGKSIAFLSDRNERNQIWLINPFGGESIQLTQSKAAVSSFAWSPNGSHIAYIAPEPSSPEQEKKEKEKDDAQVVDKDFSYGQLWTINIKTKEVVQVTSGNQHILSMDWSPDGTMFAVSASPTPKVPDGYRSDLYKVPSSGGALIPLVTQRGPDNDPKWSPDGKQIAFVSQTGTEDWWANTYLCLLPADGGDPQIVTKNMDEQIKSFSWTKDNKEIYFLAGQKTAVQLFKLNVSDRTISPVTQTPDVYISFQIAQTQDAMVFLKEDPYHPAEVYISDQNNFNSRQITQSNPHLDKIDFGNVEVISWTGVDGWKIEGVLIKPINYVTGKKYPLLVIPHGGPMGVYTRNFSGRTGMYPIQVFSGEGYLILLPNIRGSGNYGENFRKANKRDWGGKDYQDMQLGIDSLITQGLADPDALGIMGWSYGGFMTSWTITQTNRFKAASVGAGVTNLFSMFGVTDIPEFMESYFINTPWQDTNVYIDHSALFHLQNVRTPTLIQHGIDDRRVPLSQGEELYIGLKKNDVITEFVKYPREPHGLQEPKHQKDAMHRNLEWFKRWVKGK